MEGADPIVTPAEVPAWAARGVRIVGPAWGRTRYSGGSGGSAATGGPGGLTEDGLRLLEHMAESALVLDLSHMTDEAVADALPIWRGPTIASHSNARRLAGSPRQLPDETIAQVGRRGGMVGISLYERHLRADGARATWADVVAHARHLARTAGGPEHVGIGSDLDGGFAAEATPLRSLDDLAELRRALRAAFSPEQVDGILGRNWLSFLERSLPPG